MISMKLIVVLLLTMGGVASFRPAFSARARAAVPTVPVPPRTMSPKSNDEGMDSSGFAPKYDGDAKVAEFFFDDWFYRDPSEFSQDTPEVKAIVKDACKRQFKADLETRFGDKKVKELLAPIDNFGDAVAKFGGLTVRFDRIEPYYDESRKSHEDRLNGKLLTSDVKEIKLARNRFVETAIAVDGPGSTTSDQRALDIRLVMGPSGSGKTFFATMGMKKDTDTKEVKLYMKADSFITKGKETGAVEKLREVIKEMFKKEGVDAETELDMQVSVVIDEAGGLDFFGELANLQLLHNVVHEFTQDEDCAQLVVVGTGLDRSTRNLRSDTDVFKYRMRPWAPKNIESALSRTMIDSQKRETVMKQIKAIPIYMKMITNARAAHFLGCALENRLERGKFGIPAAFFVDEVIQEVVEGYIQGNGLKGLDRPECFRVARAVLKLLAEHREVVDAADLVFPEFEENASGDKYGFKSESEKFMSMSLLDYKVESRDQSYKLIPGATFAVEVSPAIAMVLFYLLGVGSSFASTWSSFEGLVAQNEIARLVVGLKPDVKSVRLYRLPKPFPPTNGGHEELSVPQLDSPSVALNGAKAPYADVIAPFRLVQTKHKKDPNNLGALDLHEELEKMGLTTQVPDNRVASQMATLTLYKKWTLHKQLLEQAHNANSVPDLERQDSVLVREAMLSTDASRQRQCYPSSLLLLSEYPGEASVKYQKETPNEIYDDDDLPKKLEIEAVFYTNAKAFKITLMTEEARLAKEATKEDKKAKKAAKKQNKEQGKEEGGDQGKEGGDLGKEEAKGKEADAAEKQGKEQGDEQGKEQGGDHGKEEAEGKEAEKQNKEQGDEQDKEQGGDQGKDQGQEDFTIEDTDVDVDGKLKDNDKVEKIRKYITLFDGVELRFLFVRQ